MPGRSSILAGRHLRKLLDVYEITELARRETLVELARRTTERGWWQAYGTAIPSEYATLIGLEEEASLIRCYQPELIDGLIQTESYARAVIRACRPLDTSEEIEPAGRGPACPAGDPDEERPATRSRRSQRRGRAATRRQR